MVVYWVGVSLANDDLWDFEIVSAHGLHWDLTMDVKVGDLVMAIEADDVLLPESTIHAAETEGVPIVCSWGGQVGIVLDVLDYDPPREYVKLKLTTVGAVGWTYSDYVRRL